MKTISQKLSSFAGTCKSKTARLLFWGHESVVRLIYGECDVIAGKRISNELLQRIQDRLASSEHRTMMGISENTEEYPYFLTGTKNYQKVENWDENLIISNLHEHSLDDPLVNAIHDELREMFSDAIKSPFAIINTRMWTTKPGAHRFGPNAMHNDQFLAGHMKIMIYVTPMDEEHGYFVYEDGEVRDKERGWTLCFANSKILHSGVPGTTQKRTCLETTIQRSLTNRPQTRKSFFLGRHYRNPFTVYF